MPAPTVTAVSPKAASINGGATATITGTDFTGTTGVTVGGVAATDVVVVSATTITCVLPAASLGVASILVTNGSGTNGANALLVLVPAPSLPLYVWFKGGRGDALMTSTWDGAHPDEIGSLDANGVPVDGQGKEAIPPYRDIFTPTAPVSFFESNALNHITVASSTEFVGTGTPVIGAPSAGAPVGTVSATLAVANSDERLHVAPRQSFAVFTWLIFHSITGAVYSARKDQVLGWGESLRQ